MVIPHGVRKIVIHFLVYDPIRLEEKKQEHERERSPTEGHRKNSPFSSTSDSSCDSKFDGRTANEQAEKQKQKQTSTNKLRKKISTSLHGISSKPRDQITNQRSTSRLSNRSAEPNVRLSMNGNPSTSWNKDLDLNPNSNIDGMEIEVLSKSTITIMDREQREEDELGEYVVMKRVVRLPRRVWCGRNTDRWLVVWFGWWLRMVVRRAEWFQEGRYMSKNEIWVDERTGGWLYR
ncbi:predicted protein [Sclerotinia sclerotiorum 1980 UF-70]|uniref:Uncharacterized protein n=1 Tax=Sclerotinia sclerotiorum (strain ATCC 18683 / 1980 / Ss-1) TaxID=665079 RepID=A7EUA6_SCLS1|nr:predicted protein [Sclerotinia sclerotiorum 1980 UF-70]EDN93048.1 predicted protein [Sclerotinia sclerotiorum 1980 UF-70]